MKLSDLNGYKVVATANDIQHISSLPKKDLLSVASDTAGSIFPGTKQIGESLGTIAAAGGRAIQGDFKGAQDVLNTQVSVPELIGAYTAAGASLASTATPAKGGVLAKALQSAGYGSLIAGGDAAAKGGNAQDVAGNVALGAAIGGGTSLAFSGAESVLKTFRGLPERLIRSATGQSKAELIKGKDISQYVLENKRIGTAEQLISSAQEAIDQADTFINSSLKDASESTLHPTPASFKGQISLKGVLADITDGINAGGGDVDENDVRSILEGLAPQVKKTLGKDTLTLTEANSLRVTLDKILGNKAFINSQLPFNKTILMDLSNAVREEVKGRAPEGVRQAFETYSKEIKLRDLLIAKTAGGSRNQIIGLGDLISGGIGAGVGGVPGALVGAGVKRVAESTIFKTTTAQIVSRLDDALTPVLSGLEPSARTAVTNALVQAFSALEEKSQLGDQPTQQ